jgi:diguanylate cyclase (GGDEF)-like protein
MVAERVVSGIDAAPSRAPRAAATFCRERRPRRDRLLGTERRTPLTQRSNKPATTKWQKGAFYELLCLLLIAECLWIIGENFELFSALATFMADRKLSSFLYLGFLMSFFFALGSLRKTLRLRGEMKARAEAEIQAHSLAREDALTKLPNRRRFVEAIDDLAGSATACALLLIDLDRFKLINDALGHEAGDSALCETARRLEAATPAGGMAARLGGDEFAMLAPSTSPVELMTLAERLITTLTAPIQYEHTHGSVGATIGIALCPRDGTTPEGLLRCADIAMYCGKRQGRGTYRFFEQAMDDELRDRASLETSLLSAITKGEIRPHYQPLVSIPDNAVRGFEVLARWYHPQRGMLSPELFIPMAEETGLITELSYVLLRQACRDAESWPPNLTLAINISQHQLKDPLLAERILAILAHARFDPGRLEIEVTESALMGDIDAARLNLQALQRAGVSVALDDFGTGYSSLSHLRDINFNRIKIDRSFVQSLGESPESGKIVDAVLALGKSLGVRTTAEGIENVANSQWLAARGCTDGQGFLFGKPMPAAAVSGQLQSGRLGAAASASGERRVGIPACDIVSITAARG